MKKSDPRSPFLLKGPSQFLKTGNRSFWTEQYSKFRNKGNDEDAPFSLPSADAPLKRGPKTIAEILKPNKESNIAKASDGDKTGRIVGRRNESRSQ